MAERQGVRSAVLAAVGNSSSSRGKLATVAEPFTVPPNPAAEQTAHVIEILESRPEIELIVAYSTEPDEAGHTWGPVAPETLAATEVVERPITTSVSPMRLANATPSEAPLATPRM